MLSTKDNIYGALNAILITEYGTTTDDSLATPCITYIEQNNSDDKTGDFLFYSRLTYQVKLWSYKVSEIENYSPQIDTAMRVLGFKRSSSYETIVDGLICRTFTYTALGKENILT